MGPLADLAPRNEALARAKAKDEFLAKSGPGFVGKLFGGVDDPRLSGEQNEAARRASVLQGGFQGLIASGQGQNFLSTVGAIGAGAGAARLDINKQVGDANEALMDETGNNETMVVELIRPGNIKHKILIDKATGIEIADLGPSGFATPPDEQELGQPMKVRRPNGDIVFASFDKKSGTFRDTGTNELLVGVTPMPVESNLQRRPFIDAAGNEFEVLWDPKTGQDVAGTVRPTGLPSTGDDKDDLNLARAIDRHVDTMINLLTPRGMEPFGLLETAAAKSDLFRGILSGPEAQTFNAAAQDVLSMVIRSRSGAQASDKEVARLQAFAIPLPGDDPATVRYKLDLMRKVAADIRGDTGDDPELIPRYNSAIAAGPGGSQPATNPYSARYDSIGSEE